MKNCLAAALALGVLVLIFRTAPGARPAPLKPTNLAKVNTKADEVDPYQTFDGHRLYYASNVKGHFHIMVSTRTKLSQPWSAGKLVKELAGDAEADKRSPFLTRDGKFYFATNSVPHDPEKKYVPNFDIYHSRKYSVRSRFTQPTPLLGVSTEQDELHGWVTKTGKEFYFSRKTEDGWRVFVAEGPSDGAITNPKLVKLPVGFHHATLSPSGLTMYMQGPLEKERWGLFRSSRSRVGAAWGKPVELTALNHPEGPRGDMSPSLSPDGTKLYFASDRPGGKGGLDLWMIPVSRLKK